MITSHVSTPRGTLRITVPLSFGQAHLLHILTGFLLRYPEVKLDLDMTDRVVDLVAEGYDLAIRIGDPANASPETSRLTAVHMVVCAVPDYLDRFGIPQSLAELEPHNCLEYRHSTGTTWPLTVSGKLKWVSVSGRYIANGGDALRDAAVSGLGLAQLPTSSCSPTSTKAG